MANIKTIKKHNINMTNSNIMLEHKHDILGMIGFISTTIFAWFYSIEALTILENVGKVLGIIGGLILMAVSIKHKSMQIHNERVIEELNNIKIRQEKVLKEVKEIKEVTTANTKDNE